jgi:hypothetical protein
MIRFSIFFDKKRHCYEILEHLDIKFSEPRIIKRLTEEEMNQLIQLIMVEN